MNQTKTIPVRGLNATLSLALDEQKMFFTIGDTAAKRIAVSGMKDILDARAAVVNSSAVVVSFSALVDNEWRKVEFDAV